MVILGYLFLDKRYLYILFKHKSGVMVIALCHILWHKEHIIIKNEVDPLEKYGVQILGTTDSQVVQQSYTSPRTHNQK
jgi:hypothetical protein